MPANKKMQIFIGYETIVAMSIYTILITSIIAGQNTIRVFGHTITSGMLIFPLTYILIAVSTEICGVKRTRAIIFFSSLCNFFMGLVIFIFTKIPSESSFFGNSSFYHDFSCRLSYFLFISTIAFMISENVNVWVISRLDFLTGWRMLIFRTFLSTSCAIIIDTWILFPISIYFIKKSAIGQAIIDTFIIMIIKMTYDLLMLPIYWVIVGIIREREKRLTLENSPPCVLPYSSVSYLHAKTSQEIKE